MNITNLSVKNVRGVTGSWPVLPVTMIIGDNFGGKSALLHAIRLAVFGWIPHPRKDTEMQPRRLMSAGDMSVAIQLDDGRSFSKSWVERGETVMCLSNPKEYELAPAIMLDPKQYFDASPAKRMQFVFNSVKLSVEEFSVEAILAAVKNIKLENNTEATEAALKVAVEKIRADCGSPTIQEDVDEIIATCSENMKLAKQSVDRMTKTVAGLTELEMKKPEQFDEEIGEVDAQLVAKREELGKLNQEKGRLEGELKTVSQRANQRTVATGLLTSEDVLIANILSNSGVEQNAKAKLAEAIPDYASGSADAEKRVTEAKASIEAISKDADRLLDEINDLKHKARVCSTNIGNARHQIEAVTQECATDLNHECCPTCDAPGTDWKQRIIDRRDSKITLLNETISMGEKAAESLTGLLTDAEARMVSMRKAGEAATTNYNAALQKHNELARAVLDTTYRKQQIEFILRECTSKSETYRIQTERIEEAKRFLAENPVESDESLRQELTAVEAQRQLVTVQGQSLNQRRTQIVANKASAASQQQAVAEREKAEAELAIWKETIKVVSGFKQKMVDTAFGSMMGIANRFSDGILDSTLEYRDGEVGRARNGRFVPQDQFSDAEQIVTYAAMSVALAATTPFRLVLVDELTRVRGGRKKLIIDRMLKLVEDGIISQFFGVDVETDNGEVPTYYQHEKVGILKV